jgi:hypothetical protein
MSRELMPCLQPHNEASIVTDQPSGQPRRLSTSARPKRTCHEKAVPSLKFTQRIERRLAQYNASQSICKSWLLEIACWMLSAAFPGLCGQYLHAHQQHASSTSEQLINSCQYPWQVASATLIVSTTKALGQLKWN